MPQLVLAETLTAEARLEARIAELERFCGQLALENAVLKKLRRQSRLDVVE